MHREEPFFKTVCRLAIPAALQSMLQSSFGMVDQIMLGQLGAVCVAGVGLAGKFAGVYSVVISTVGAAAGIMLSQYMGQQNRAEVRRSFLINLLLGTGIAAAFTAACVLFPHAVMGVYTTDGETRQAAAAYLAPLAGGFLPAAGATLLAVALRCAERARLPLYAGIAGACVNTALNYVLIFGKLGFPAMGAAGAAIATVVSQWTNLLLMLCMTAKCRTASEYAGAERIAPPRVNVRQYLSLLLPMLVCEISWSLGENVYAVIYGHMGTDESAAMTLSNPVQGLVIGALCGLSQAAGVIVGKKLGGGDAEGARHAAKKLLAYGAAGSALLSAAVVSLRGWYADIYPMDAAVKALTRQVLLAYALVAPCKVLNMILGGGILRSGGRTKYVMYIDMIGTWCFGVPLGLLGAFVWRLPVPQVYFLLSLEEVVRLCLSAAVFRRRKWMHRLDAAAP